MGHLGGAALVAAGCVHAYDPVRLRTGVGPASQEGRAAITEIGEMVLRFIGRASRSTSAFAGPN